MPRNFNKYQYETSPRKLEPEYTPKKNPYKSKKTTSIKKSTKKSKEKELRKQRINVVKYIIIGFFIIFGISFRNSQIDESFSKIQEIKDELSEVKKQNAQLEVSIENGLNLNNLEQEAKEQLGMQKLNPRQITYITLPKNDYIEPAAEEVKIAEEGNTITNIIDKITSLFK